MRSLVRLGRRSLVFGFLTLTFSLFFIPIPQAAARESSQGSVVVSAFILDWPFVLKYKKEGLARNDNLGTAVAGAGDVNNDGYGDFIVGAPFTDPNGLTDAGSAFVYSGRDGALLFQKDGGAAGDEFGLAVSGAGDVNNDGYDDFIVGAPLADPGALADAGSAYVYSGLNGTLLYQKNGNASGQQLGHAVASAGHVNADAFADFIVGVHAASPNLITSAGIVFVFSGADGSVLHQKNGTELAGQLGYSVAGLGDINGDGFDDFAAGANRASPGFRSNAGSVFVYSGSGGGLLFQKDGTAAGDQLGYSTAGGGDVNNDGVPDLAAGAPGANPGGLNDAGSAYVFSGATGGVLYQKNGIDVSNQFGLSVAIVGDATHDGFAEFLAGAPLADPGGRGFAGTAVLFSGATGDTLLWRAGASAGDQLGFAVAALGDLNADGYADFAIGAPFTDPADFNLGTVLAFLSGYEMTLTSVANVPDDQGRQFQLNWKSRPTGSGLGQKFQIFRRDSPPFGAVATPPGTWSKIKEVPVVVTESLYTTTVQTPTNREVFFVRNVAADTTIFFDSNPDSGVATDELFPPAPAVTVASTLPCSALVVSWHPVAAPDLEHYEVFRDTIFNLATKIFLANVGRDTVYVDRTALPNQFYFYLVVAQDSNGNRSFSVASGANLQTGDVDGDGLVDIIDVIGLINDVAHGEPLPNPLGGDTDCNGVRDIVDVVLLIQFVVFGSPSPCCLSP